MIGAGRRTEVDARQHEAFQLDKPAAARINYVTLPCKERAEGM